MKRLKLRGLVHVMVCASVLVLITGAAFGASITYNFDENCNGTVVTGGGSAKLDCQMWKDPTSGTTTALYRLPGALGSLTSGDFRVLESPALGDFSDVLRFNQDLGGVFVFSDNDGAADMADVGIPVVDITHPFVQDFEVSLGGNKNGVSYNPGSGNPGFQPGNDVTYNFVSDTPEPATYLLLAVPLALISLRRRLHRTVN